MIHSLRTKLAASHILPILLLMPILSLYLLYSLESFYTQNLLQQLTYQARLLQNRAESDHSIMEDQKAAQSFLTGIAQLTDARVLLLAKDATILGSTRPEDSPRLGTQLTGQAVKQALSGEEAQGIGQGFSAEVAYVVLPLEYRGTRIGALRVSYEVTDVRAQFNQLQWLVLGGVAATAALALALGLTLATTIMRPLRRLSEGVQRIAAGNYQARVPSDSRDEVGTLARNFNTMATRLHEIELARQRQLAAITHELARPLTGMRAAVETLNDGAVADPEMRQTLLDGILEQVARLQRLIETLQTVQKRALRPMDLNLAEVSLERVIRASVGNYEALAAQHQIALRHDLPRDLRPVRADEDRLIQVLTNLLDNALKFTPPGGRIVVQARQDGDAACVTVSDTGTGIAAEELPFLFQEFYHGGPSQPPEKHGMGLGLTICREIIRAHGGSIWAESEFGQGARFTFKLPR
jgi:signal transduction histidine kinase